MAMRCFGRARGLAAGSARALALICFRAVDLAVLLATVLLATVLRAGDFFCAAVRAAARDVGFFLAIPCLHNAGRTRLSDAPLVEVSSCRAQRQLSSCACFAPTPSYRHGGGGARAASCYAHGPSFCLMVSVVAPSEPRASSSRGFTRCSNTH